MYGLLAHSHDWQGASATPTENVTRALRNADLAEVHHPREMLDILCVADLATWSSSQLTFIGPSMVNPWTEALVDIYGANGCMSSSHMGPADWGADPGNPIGIVIAQLLQHLAWEDRSLRPLADYWRVAGLWGAGSGVMRHWDVATVYTPPVAARVIAGGSLVNGEAWHEWSMGFP